jgi:hypothetical protein
MRMNHKNYLLLSLVSGMVFWLMACDIPGRVSALEKQNSELRAEIQKLKSTSDYDMQEKCNRDAKEWLNTNWQNSKDTVFMTYNSHYNRASNSCFIVVEHHVKSPFGDNGSWSNVIEMWDVLENTKYASIQEDHLVHMKPSYSVGDTVVECEVRGKECKTLDEFNTITRPYMAN